MSNTEYLNNCIHVEYNFVSFTKIYKRISNDDFSHNLPIAFLGLEERFDTQKYLGILTYHNLKDHDEIKSISKREKGYSSTKIVPICSSLVKISDIIRLINILKRKTFKERDYSESELKIAKVNFKSLYIQNESSVETNIYPLFFPCYNTAMYTLIHQLRDALKKTFMPDPNSVVCTTGYKFVAPKQYFLDNMNKYETYLI